MSESTAPDGPSLTLRGIHKRFPGVHALRGIDLDVRRGEVRAVVGENGAGKSTLMQIVAGVYPPDAGRIGFDGGGDVAPADERAAQGLGIALAYQERSLFGPLSVAENVFAARQPVTRWGRIDRAALAARTRALLDEVGLDVAVGAKAEIHELLYGLARSGTGVVVISSDLPEVLAVSDRVLVMRAGRITGELARGEATEAAVMGYASLR